MSLEAIIEENTAAIKQLISTLQLLNTPVILPGPVKVVAPADEGTTHMFPGVIAVQGAAPKTKKTKKEVAPEPRPLEPSAPSTGSGATDASETEAAVVPAVSRADVSAALTKVSATKGRNAAIGILKQVGATNLGAVKEEDYAAVICACELALS